MAWWDGIIIDKFKVDNKPDTFDTLEEAYEVAEKRAIKKAKKSPNERVCVEITGWMKDTDDVVQQWYFITEVSAELKVTRGEDDD